MEKYYKRNIDNILLDWSKEQNRKPLLLRGARQVGKTTAIRHLADHFEYFAEIDFNDRKDIHYLFDGTYSPLEICQLLSILIRVPIIPGRTLLFFDEIQSCPAAINRLRYFYEKYPEIHLIAAGSLLEFALESLPSYGVGRIRSIFMYPFSFEEFLWASGDEFLAKAINQASPQNPLPEAIHNQAIRQLKAFLVLGGMPDVVARYCEDGNILECQRILSELILSFRDDFAKYRNKVPALRIDAVFRSVAEQGLGKFVYNRVNSDGNTEQIRTALETLILAGLIYPVTHTSANGIPLGAEINEKYRRMIYMDTGLLQCILNLDLSDFFASSDI
ncbi:MAG: AAA family ATPase [Paraprevotella sp.]|nr:AAA family ATPase [Paraprevotella sp.]